MQGERPPTLEYEAKHRPQRSRLRLGAVSLTIAVIAIVANIMLMNGLFYLNSSMLFRALAQATPLGGFWIGILGLLQQNGRRLAICGILISYLATAFIS